MVQNSLGQGLSICSMALGLSFFFSAPIRALLLALGLSRTSCVSIEGQLSDSAPLVYGVPQGSVKGPLDFDFIIHFGWHYP